MKKIFSVVLSVCMLVMYSVPAFAYSSNDATKVQLSDQAMAGAVGGLGPVQAQILENANGSVTALITNGPNSISCDYTLTTGMNIQGGGGTVVASGSVGAGQSIMVTEAASWYTRINVVCPSAPALTASASTYASE